MPQSSTAAAHQSAKTDKSRKQPVEKFSHGKVEVSIWENESVKGKFRNATVQLPYKHDKKGWQSGSYGVNDLEDLESAAREARSRIKNWQEQSKAKPEPEPAA
jgi:hypothetical protein